MVHELLAVSVLVRLRMKVVLLRDDPPDNRIVEGALEGEAASIVSGDRHLFELDRF